MKKNEIVVGGHYIAKVSNNLTTVRVDGIREVETYRSRFAYGSGRGSRTVYEVTNLRTGRHTTFHSAAKFRRAVVAKTEVLKSNTTGTIESKTVTFENSGTKNKDTIVVTAPSKPPCVACGGEMISGSIYCPKCGNGQTTVKETAPLKCHSCKGEPLPENMRCVYCGNKGPTPLILGVETALIAKCFPQAEIRSIARRSKLPYDLTITGCFPAHPITKRPECDFQSWLPLALLRTSKWTSDPIASACDHPEMAKAGDWSAIRDSNPVTIWALFAYALKTM